MNKSGIYFTLFALMAVSLLIISFGITSKYTKESDGKIIEDRIISTDKFIYDLERDAERALYIAGFRAFLGLDEYMEDHTQGAFVKNLNESLKELIMNGTMENGSVLLNTSNGSSFREWIQNINFVSDKTGLIINMTINDVIVKHISPWEVNISVDTNFSIQDKSDIALWNTYLIINTIIDVEGFFDPLYINGTKNTYGNSIKRSPFAYFVNCSNNDTNNLLNHTLGSYYIENNNSPSFLMRFEGDLNASPHGIESLVNVRALDFSLQYNKSVVDWIYFYNNSFDSYQLVNMTDWFYIDNESDRLCTYGCCGNLTR